LHDKSSAQGGWVATFAIIAATLTTPSVGLASLTNGLVAYWPFDSATGRSNQTPDVVHGYNMQVIHGAGISGAVLGIGCRRRERQTTAGSRGNQTSTLTKP
jgi:hypothetical protein